ncbi:branched-chain amino acid ABC transporter permease [Hypericibacter adhaerens]|uniref:Branched-chain amino acid ABC transporter permease n=2 Tax=Hypericibacter adhaerens TaxID=2602016 RepID=A0A5J6MVD5_9PROT|nr:branched-chain amino acid ABC transporter permease [Hypericibacter adhaerens]
MRAAKLAVLLGALVLAPLFVSDHFILSILIAALMFGVFGAIYDLMVGYCGLTNFGYAGFIAAGSYASALGASFMGVNPWVGLLVGGILCMALGFFTGLIALRVKGLYLGLLTWFVGETIRLTIANSTEITRGMLGLTVMPFPDLLGIDFSRANLHAYYYALLVIGTAIVLACWWLVNSNAGRAFKAIRDDELAAESLGLSATKYKLINFSIASFFTGIVGAFYAHYIGILSPSPTEFGVSRTIEVLTVTYLGGRGTLFGPIFSGFLIVGFQEALRGIGAWRLILFGALLISVMLFFPRGLATLKKWLW